MARKKYPDEAPIFESDRDLTCGGKHVEGSISDLGTLRIRCGCFPLSPEYPVHSRDVKPLTPAARAMVAIAKAGGK